MSRWCVPGCRGEYLWSHPEPVAAFAAPTLEKLGLINALGYAPGDMHRQIPQPGAWQSCNMKVAIPYGASGNFRHAPVTAAADAFSDVIDRVEQALVSAGWQVERRAMICNFCGSIRRLRLAIISSGFRPGL